MKIIDAHMHYYDIDKFYEVAENAGHENTQCGGMVGKGWKVRTVRAFTYREAGHSANSQYDRHQCDPGSLFSENEQHDQCHEYRIGEM